MGQFHNWNNVGQIRHTPNKFNIRHRLSSCDVVHSAHDAINTELYTEFIFKISVTSNRAYWRIVLSTRLMNQ